MFRPMRRARQQLSQEQAREIMERGRTGVLALLGDQGYPYALPINYVWHEGRIYFHCAREGHKLDAIAACPKVSLCVVDRDQVQPEKFTTLYRSAIAFGRARRLEPGEASLQAIRLLNRKYAPGLEAQGEAAIEKSWAQLCLVEIQVEHLTGKQAKDLSSGGEGE